jgi:hypothetical protein
MHERHEDRDRHTVTLWPDKKRVEYRGNPLAGIFGYKPQPELRTDPEATCFREGASYEWLQIYCHEQAVYLAEHHVYNQDYLVSSLLDKGEGFTHTNQDFTWDKVDETSHDVSTGQVLGWYRVSKMLCDALEGAGFVTLQTKNYGCWWGRTEWDQPLVQDGVLQVAASRILGFSGHAGNCSLYDRNLHFDPKEDHLGIHPLSGNAQ